MNFYSFKNLIFFTFLTTIFLIFVEALNELNEFTLPNLIGISTLAEISNDWFKYGDTIFDEGRIILTPKPNHVSKDEKNYQFGSLWSIKNPIDLNSFTIELTIRSIGSFGLTNAGFSLFFIDESNLNLESFDNFENFGGPSIFKGLQILINMDKEFGPVIRPYLNDGSKKIDIQNDYLGAYKYEYQSSNVPITLKISYETGFFKITADNKLLFKTEIINLNSLLNGKLKLGLTSISPINMALHEQFEILKLTTYNYLTDEMKEENTATLISKHSNSLTRNQPGSVAFREQQRKLRDQILLSKSSSSLNNEDLLIDIQSNIALILSSINNNEQISLQKQIFSLSKSVDKLSNNFVKLNDEFNKLNNKYNELSNMFKRQFEIFDNYDLTLRSFDTVLKNQLSTSNKLDNKLSTLSSQYNNKIDENDYSNLLSNDDSFGKIKSLLYIIFLSLVTLLIFVALWVHRLRNDIKHSKIL